MARRLTLASRQWQYARTDYALYRSGATRRNSRHRWNAHMMKVIVAILLIAAMPVFAQAKSRSAQRMSNGNGVPNWDVSSSCRAAAKVAYTEDAAAREKSCMEGEQRTREKLVADWSTFPAAERIRCIKSIEWFSPTYTELVACLEMYGQVRNLRENPASATPYKLQR